MVRTVIEAGYLPAAKDNRFDPVELLTSAVEIWIHRWDHLVEALAHETSMGTVPDHVRVTAVDLAIRCGAFDELFDSPPLPLARNDRSEIPWAQEDAARDQLARLPIAFDITRERWQPSHKKEWFVQQHSRPSAQTFSARPVPNHDQSSATGAVRLRYLQWFFALARLSDDAARVVGCAATIDVASTFLRTRLRARQLPVPSRHRDAGLAEIVVLGAYAPSASPLLDELRRITANTTDIAVAPTQAAIQVFASSTVAHFESVAARPRAFDFVYGVALGGAGRIPDALTVFERVIERVPGHALALEQAARSCYLLGRMTDAAGYAKRASRIGRISVKRPPVLRRDR